MTVGVVQCRPASESSRVKLGAASNIRLGHRRGGDVRPDLAARGRSGAVHSFGGMQCRPTSGSSRVGLGAAFSIRPGVIHGCFLGCRASCVSVGVVGRESVPLSSLGGHRCGAVPSNLRDGPVWAGGCLQHQSRFMERCGCPSGVGRGGAAVAVHSFGGMQCLPASGAGRVGLGAAFSIRPGVIRDLLPRL